MNIRDNFLLKTLTVVSGPDMVDLTFHNFVSYKDNVGKVCGGHRSGPWGLPGNQGTGLGCGVWWHLWGEGPDRCALGSCRTGLKTYWLWPSTR